MDNGKGIESKFPLKSVVKASDWLQNGIVDKAGSTLAFVDGTRVFTINRTGTSFDYFVQGIKYTVTTDDVSAVNTVTLTDTEGLWAIYYDGSTLTALNSPSHSQFESVIMTKCIVAIVYYDATNNKGILYEERHGASMAPWTHRYLHEHIGFAYISGLGLGDFVISDGADDEDAQFSIAAGECYDEDNAISLNAVNSTTAIDVFYRVGSDWRWTTQTGFKCITFDGTSSTRLAYDDSGTLTEVSNRDFVLIHVFATTAYDGDPIAVLGQAEYSNRGNARDGAETEVANLLLGALPSAEMKPIASIIFQTADTYANAVQARVIETDSGDNYIDWRGSTLAQGVAAANHGSLGGLGSDDHIQYTRERTVYNTQTSTAYTLVQDDRRKTTIMANGANPYALTFPPTAGIFEVGDNGISWKTGSGEITGTKGSGVTLDSALTGNVNFKFDIGAPFQIRWEVLATDTYQITGAIKAV